MTGNIAPSLRGALDGDVRRDLEEVSRSIPLDAGGGASFLKVLVLSELIASEQLETVVEIGVYRGRLLLPLGRLMVRRGRGEVIGIDPYSAAAAVQRDVEREGIDLNEWPTTIDWAGLYAEVGAAIARWDLEERVRLIRKTSEEAVGELQSVDIDLLHVDGNHDHGAVTRDIELYLPRVNDGGLLVMDDIAWPTVRPVYESLLREHELVFSLIESGLALCPDDSANDFAVLRVRK